VVSYYALWHFLQHEGVTSQRRERSAGLRRGSLLISRQQATEALSVRLMSDAVESGAIGRRYPTMGIIFWLAAWVVLISGVVVRPRCAQGRGASV
jgi:hypothetical protein